MKLYKAAHYTMFDGHLKAIYDLADLGPMSEIIGKTFSRPIGYFAYNIMQITGPETSSPDFVLLEVEVGKELLNEDHYDSITVLRIVQEDEIQEMLLAEGKLNNVDLLHAWYPVDPLKCRKPFNKEEALLLLDNWKRVFRNCENDMYWNSWRPASVSVWCSCGNKLYSETYGRGDSISEHWDSINALSNAYAASLFIGSELSKKYESGAILWNNGWIPVLDIREWYFQVEKERIYV